MKLSDFEKENYIQNKEVFFGGRIKESDKLFLKEKKIKFKDLISQCVKELKAEHKEITLNDNQIISEFKEWRKTSSSFFNGSSIRLEEIALWTKYIIKKECDLN